MTQHYEQIRDLANAHGQLLLQERELLHTLQTSGLEKNSALAQLQTMLTELTAVNHRQLTESAEKEKKLEDANKRLEDSNYKIDRLSEDLRSCKMQVEAVNSEKNNALAQLQTTRELVLMTKQRELKKLNMVEEVSAMMSLFQENTVQKIAEHIKKQDKPTESGNSKDVNKTAELNLVDSRGSSLPG